MRREAGGAYRWIPAGGRVAVLACAALAGPALAAVLPPGFENSTAIPAGVIPGPESISWAPDGSMWIAQSGPGEGMSVWVWRGGTPTRARDFGTIPTGERGIHAVVVDPDYLQDGHVWVYYTVLDDPPVRNRLSRFTNVDDLLTGEAVILEGPAVLDQIHNGGCLAMAADGTLYLGMGDDAQGSTTAQDPFDLRGKLLHLERDGSPAADNMFPGGTSGDARIWAMGVRNPFRCNLQPGSDNLFFGDVGSNQYEEIDVGVAGGNFGWQLIEGPEPAGIPGFVYPIHSYSRFSGAAVIGGVHATSGDFDPQFDGDYFFGDYVTGEIWRAILDDDNNPVSVEPWASDMGHLVDLEFGPDGALYYATRQTGYPSVGRIEYVGGANRQPTARGAASPDSGSRPLSVTLDGSASSDPDDDTLSYLWDPGHGGAESGPTVVHSYPKGVYEVVLTVDDGTLSDVSPPIRIVSGNHRPTATITAPALGTTYNAGQPISYSGTGSDVEEGAIPCTRLGWQVIFHHGEHTHPFLGPEQGNCAGSFTTADRGETSADTWYEIRLIADDTGVPVGGDAVLNGEQSVEIFPDTVTLALASLPRPDLTLTLDTGPVIAPFSVEGVVGFIRSIGAAELQLASDGHTYRWLSWSDAGALVHEIATPAVDTTYTAQFGCDVLVEVDPLTVELVASTENGVELALSWPPLTDACLSNGASRYEIYAAASPVPSTLPGDFPDDPAFTLVGATADTSFHHVAPPEQRFFLVVARGTDLLDGAIGHYGE